MQIIKAHRQKKWNGINKLDVETAKITYASIKELDVVKENAEEINAKKANIDLANVNNAWIEKAS